MTNPLDEYETSMISDFFKEAGNLIGDLEKLHVSHVEEFRRLSTIDEVTTGRILRCHLLIEHYINEYLAAAYPTIVNWDKLRLGFEQKFQMSNNNNQPSKLYYDGIILINKIRNKLAHNLYVDLQSYDLQPLIKVIEPVYLRSKRKIPENIELIEAFTDHTCFWLALSTKQISNNFSKLGLAGIHEHWRRFFKSRKKQ